MVGNTERKWLRPRNRRGNSRIGDRLLATARDPQRLNDLVERYGGHVYTAPLDVADEAAAKAAVAKAVDAF
jgi:NADP-dependent 3-hydroxy acid dehydrogenase YdfG